MPTLERPVILIVEDDQPLRTALTTKLTAEGYIVLQAKNGQEGLDTAKANKPDLILLDLFMPVMDGLTMLSTLRLDSWGKNASVIILSNNSDDVRIAEAVKSGVYEYIIKSDRSLKEVSNEIKEKLEHLRSAESS